MRQQVSKESESGTTLNARLGKTRPSNGTSKMVKEAPQNSSDADPTDSLGLACIRRLDRGIGTDPEQRIADRKFIERNYGYSDGEIHTLFASSDGHVLNALKRRREERRQARNRSR